jgi:hypothetical protein
MNRVILILIFVQLVGAVFATADPKPKETIIDHKKWEKISKGYDFTENFKNREPKKPEQPKNAKSIFSKLNPEIIKYLVAAIVLIGLSILLIFLLISVYKDGREKFAGSLPNLHIEDIENADLDFFLEQALSNKSYKEAIRIRYLILLKTLNTLRFVIWKKDKTNGNYVNEMYGKVGFDLFSMLTVNFERVWYGEKEVNENDYLNLIPVFDQMNSMVTGETSTNRIA